MNYKGACKKLSEEFLEGKIKNSRELELKKSEREEYIFFYGTFLTGTIKAKSRQHIKTSSLFLFQAHDYSFDPERPA